MKSQWIYQQFANVNMNDARLQKRAVEIAQAAQNVLKSEYRAALMIGLG